MSTPQIEFLNPDEMNCRADSLDAYGDKSPNYTDLSIQLRKS